MFHWTQGYSFKKEMLLLYFHNKLSSIFFALGWRQIFFLLFFLIYCIRNTIITEGDTGECINIFSNTDILSSTLDSKRTIFREILVRKSEIIKSKRGHVHLSFVDITPLTEWICYFNHFPWTEPLISCTNRKQRKQSLAYSCKHTLPSINLINKQKQTDTHS